MNVYSGSVLLLIDLPFCKRLSLYYGDELHKWLLYNNGKVVTLWQIYFIFEFVFILADTMRTAVKEFEKTDMFTACEFATKSTDFRRKLIRIIQQVKTADAPAESVFTPDQQSLTYLSSGTKV